MQMSGMEIAAIRQLARLMDQRAETLESGVRRLTQRVQSLEWAGADRERFVGEWTSNHGPKLAAAAAGLRDAAERARRHANEQERISRGA